MKETPVNKIMENTLEKMREMVDVSTIIGDPMVTGDTTLIPVSKVTYGFTSGGTDLPSKQQNQELFGGGGGMVLVPLLNGWCGLAGKQAFATCVAAILPLSAVSAAVYLLRQPFDWAAALPYLIGGLVGGLVGGRLFRRVSVTWLRGLFAAFLLYGGVRYIL